MHLLAAQPGRVSDGSEAVDLGQTPGDIVFLSAADTELASLSSAWADLGEGELTLRLANLMQLSHPMSVDLYMEQVLEQARLVVVRVLGGRGYWSYGVEQLEALARERGVPVAFLPGDDKPDPDLASSSSLEESARNRLWQYCIHGGPENARNLLAYACSLLGRDRDWREPAPLLRAGPYWPGLEQPDLSQLRERWREGAPVAAIVFYRALLQAGNLAPVDALVEKLQSEGINPLPIYCTSLKEEVSASTLQALLEEAGTGLVLNATGFAVSSPSAERSATPFDSIDAPVLQVVFAGSDRESWEAGSHGLSARDIAMNVALPEVDGRLLTRAISFKGEALYDPATQTSVVRYEPVADRVAFVAGLAGRWLKLRDKPMAERRIALVLANYPNRDGRMGNGVGLDTPAGTITLLQAMAAAGYDVRDLPGDGDALVAYMAEGPTNAGLEGREIRETLPRPDYEFFFGSLPQALQEAVLERWGPPEADPFYLHGELDCGAFALPAFRLGKVLVGLQPARGYNIDPERSYHDPDLVPPHAYLAFYAWLQLEADAVVHMGKHGNLEWLPGKALALSEGCFPEAALGPMPHIYPFIVNDPGEGTQAKRRAQAVIIDHLTPPLTRAETYGPLKDLELLVDEYYEAAGVDPRRIKVLRQDILDVTRRLGLDSDCGISENDDEDQALAKLDNHLCELKEMQIRDGLHIFGQSPDGDQLTDLLVALVRIPRGKGEGGDASLLRALVADLELDFDPLDCDFATAWQGPYPDVLQEEGRWRTAGDTVERLEGLARALVAGVRTAPESWPRTRDVLDRLEQAIRPAVEACGAAEIKGILKALDGGFVLPGPSGAPTRGRPDVLPTGRNFYSVDSRVVPTPAAWTLGWKSATRLLERHRQEHGGWPKTLALSAWGTANMRTGGDDIAQALALLGVQPTWETASRRVTGFEILPLSVLDRPRVDVTLRISGFFRDAFPNQIDLFDSAVRAVAELDEPEAKNPLAARVKADAEALVGQGIEEAVARQRAGYRVFGSKPGAYGAGLQALIDEKGWDSGDDLARAYVAWGGYAYGQGAEGAAEHDLFEERLGAVEAVVHNQDNREHDLLDSDDYYQFEGGLSVSIESLSGKAPTVYHNDHSRPERPVIRTLQEEIGRVVRARVVNPKWIAGVMRHGYKGAFEMAATVDYLFAFAATTHAVRDHHFDAVFDAYLDNAEVLDFLESHNPEALKEMAERMNEALERGLWKPRANTAYARLNEITGKGM
ncbi:cobaltochelatase subunit CobN [Fodinicurvata sediminis]|uniref:cobaltochelatase subunit CobN n=1 Tax=Fodinicurvata sediminis TaxID=1121832 RepID=UPI0003B799B2|nr:cobaltochelatase subunit CobN [Fodinicurvata sediminis]